MEYIIIACVSLIVAGLTFFSGFGLGTLLMPAFALFVPVEAAIAGTAIVHLANNLFKLSLIGGKADRGIVVRFAVPAAITAALGALLLNFMAASQPLYTYQIGGRLCEITILKLVIGGLMLVFALFELVPSFSKLQFSRKLIPLGGLLSGFFGGLSGHQGALRTAFLLRAGLSKEAYLGTIVTSAVIVDISRLAIYGTTYFTTHFGVLAREGGTGFIGTGIAAALIGSFTASRFLSKITLGAVKLTVGILLLIFSVALSTGVI